MKSTSGCALVIIVLAACVGDENTRGADSAGTGDPISIRRSREVDLSGDRRPERFVVLASGARFDSLTVTLEIRSPEDSLLYTDSWGTELYFVRDDPATRTDSGVEHRVRAQIDSLVGDMAFRPGGTPLTTDDRSIQEGMRDAIREDVAEEMWRRANQVPIDSSTPASALDAIAQMARDSVSDARVESLVAELRDRPTFRYFTGDGTYALAWSEEERRFVTVWACC